MPVKTNYIPPVKPSAERYLTDWTVRYGTMPPDATHVMITGIPGEEAFPLALHKRDKDGFWLFYIPSCGMWLKSALPIHCDLTPIPTECWENLGGLGRRTPRPKPQKAKKTIWDRVYTWLWGVLHEWSK